VLQHRFRPGSLRLREVLQSGALGKVEAAAMLVPWWRPQSYYDEPGRGTMARDGGGVLLTQAIHTLDLFRSLVGIAGVDAAQVKRTSVHKMETEDYVAALVRLGDGGFGTIMTTTAFHPGLSERIEIIGSLGSAALIGNDLKIAWIDGRTEEIKGDSRTGGGASIMDFSHEPHRAVLTDFLDALVEDRDPIVSGEEALASQRVVYDVLKKGGWS
jgi:predicted dehydrogenase